MKYNLMIKIHVPTNSNLADINICYVCGHIYQGWVCDKCRDRAEEDVYIDWVNTKRGSGNCKCI